MRAIGMRAAYGLGVLLAFAVGSIGAFLLFDWPPLLKQIVLAYLLVFLIVRLVLVLGRILLAPGAERFRVIPMATPAASFWFVWSAILVGWFFFARVTLDLLALLGVGRSAGYLIGLACGVVLVGLTLYVVWRHPARQGDQPASREHRLGASLLSVYVVVAWLLLFTGTATLFYVGVILLLLALALRSVHLAVPRAAPGGQRHGRARPVAHRGHGRARPARRSADRRRLSDRVGARPRFGGHEHARHHGDAPRARRDQCRGHPADCRSRLASGARVDRLQTGRGARCGGARRGGGPGAGRACGRCCRS